MKPNRKPKIFFLAATATFYSEDLHGYVTKLVDDPDWEPPKINALNPNYDPADPKWKTTLRVVDEDAQPNQVPDPEWQRPEIEINNPDYNPDDQNSPATITVPDETAQPGLIDDPDWQRPQKEIPNPDYDEKAHQQAKNILVPDPSVKPPKIEVANSDHMIPDGAVEVTQSDFNTIQKQLEQVDSELVADEDGKPMVNVSLSLDEAKRRKRLQINNAADRALDSITRQYPRTEIDSWPIQASEAEAWQADNSAGTPLLDAIVNTRDVEKSTLVDRILANSTAFKQASGNVFGKRQAMDTEVDNATTLEEVDAINTEEMT